MAYQCYVRPNEVKTLEYLHKADTSLAENAIEFQKAFERAQSLETQLQLLQEDKLTREHQLRNEMDRERERASHYEQANTELGEQLAQAGQDVQASKASVIQFQQESVQYRGQMESLTADSQQQQVAHFVQCASGTTLRFQINRLQDERDSSVESETTLRIEIAKLREEGMILETELRQLLGLEEDGDLRFQLKQKAQKQQRQMEGLQNQNALLNDESSAEKVNRLQKKVEALQDQNVLLQSKAAEEKEKCDAMDTNGDGVIDREEFAAAMEKPSTVDASTETDGELASDKNTPDEELALVKDAAVENELLQQQLQDSIAQQLAGDMGCHARARNEPNSTMSDAGRYVLWKARYALEQARYEELLQDYEALKLRVEGESLLTTHQNYDKYKIAACTQDFADLLQLGFVGVTGKDNFGIPVVVFAAKFLPKGIPFDRLMEFLIYVLDDIVAQPFHLVYIHSEKGEDAAELDPGLMKQALDLLPFKYKRNISRLFILHPDFWFRMFYMGNKAILPEKMQSKVVYLDTVEDLFTNLGKRSTILPGYAYEHEGMLHGSREILVRAKRVSWNDAMEQEEQNAKRKLLERDLNTIDFLLGAKDRYVKEEMYADAELVKDEMIALYDEINALKTDLGEFNEFAGRFLGTTTTGGIGAD